jgi:enoyl-[acyl-carrier protein] reductase / trans-2-enoyl-CoA reductase (NAD+)
MSKQVVQPRIRGFISLTAHPEGCAEMVRRQVAVVRDALRQAQGERFEGSLGNVLVIGSSTGYGLASTLVACLGYGARTLGVCFERAPEGDRPASAGWYNIAEAHRLAREQRLHIETVNGDAFSADVKGEVFGRLRERFGPLDVVIYSLAAPRRQGPEGAVWHSVLKPVGERYEGKGFDLRNERVVEASAEPASEEEVADTVKVMGGEDWRLWIESLLDAGLLAPGVRTVAYSYIGPELSAPIYRRGTIGRAKEHLEATAHELDALLAERAGGHAWVSINKGVVTQASAAIPAVPLYMSILFKVMKEDGSHEGTVEQIVRLFRDHIGPGREPLLDDARRIRLDDREMQPSVQGRVAELWQAITTEGLREMSDFASFKRDFENLFGFSVDGIDYDEPVEIDRSW